MRRDFELIRKILAKVEEMPARGELRRLPIDGYDTDTVTAHVQMLADEGFIEANISNPRGGQVHITRMMWKGHDFYDAMKDEGIWKKAKDTVLKPVGGVAFEVLLAWLKAEAVKQLGLPPS